MTFELETKSIDEQLTSFNVSDVMSTNLLTVYEGWSIRKLSQFFLKHNISGAPVVAADESLVGVVTQSDVIRFETKLPSEMEVAKMVEQYCGPFNRDLPNSEIVRIQNKANDYCTVNSIMTPAVLKVSFCAPVITAYKLLLEHDVHRLFVTKDDMLVGVITAMDVLKSLKSSIS